MTAAPAGDGWVAVCSVDDIPVLGARVVRRSAPPGVPPPADVAIFRTADDRVFALLDRCPHKGGPLSQGIVHGESVACPLHNWTIRLASGEAAAPDEGCARVFAVRLDGRTVMLSAAQLGAVAETAGAH